MKVRDTHQCIIQYNHQYCLILLIHLYAFEDTLISNARQMVLWASKIRCMSTIHPKSHVRHFSEIQWLMNKIDTTHFNEVNIGTVNDLIGQNLT